jgi:hypothetical protein
LNNREERWAQIEGFPDYAVSSHGRVLSLRYNQELKPRPNSYGGLRVVLYRDKERFDCYVHHLVAAAFITEYSPGTQVRHRDDNKNNNNVYNLRFPLGRRMGTLVRNPPNPAIRRLRIVESGLTFRTVEDCARYIGGDPSSIYRVLRGDRLSHKGYTFEYVVEENQL